MFKFLVNCRRGIGLFLSVLLPKRISLIWKVFVLFSLFQSIVLIVYSIIGNMELDKRLEQEKFEFTIMSEGYLTKAIKTHVENIQDIIYKATQNDTHQDSAEFLAKEWLNLPFDRGVQGAALYQLDNKHNIAYKYGGYEPKYVERYIKSTAVSDLPDHYIVCQDICIINIVIPLKFDLQSAVLVISTSLKHLISQFQDDFDLKTVVLSSIKSVSVGSPLAKLPSAKLSSVKVSPATVSPAKVSPTKSDKYNWLNSGYEILRKETNKYYYEALKLASETANFDTLINRGFKVKLQNEYYYITAFPIPFDIENKSYLIIFNDISSTQLLDEKFNRIHLLFLIATLSTMLFIIFVVLNKLLARINALKDYLPTLAKRTRINVLPTNHGNVFQDEIDALENSSNDLAKSLSQFNTVVKDRECKLKKIALYDSLTGIANREHFFNVLQNKMCKLAQNSTFMALFFIDLDRFKHVNDTFGHDVGDEVLKMVAKRLQNSVRASDLVARLGGDEFTILLDNLNSKHSILKIVKLILNSFHEPASINNHMININLSIGITIVNNTEDSVTEVLRQADIAMYNAKSSKSKRFSFFKNEMEGAILNEFSLLSEFPDALITNQLKLHFQPIYSIQNQKLLGFECLIRWDHSERGLLNSETFLSVLKDTKYMTVLENWILKEGIKSCREINNNSVDPLFLAINFSGDIFMSTDLISNIKKLLKTYQVDAKLFYLEIVEDTLIRDLDAAIYRIKELQELGMKVSLDDFGAGYSSISYLKRLPADIIKIDRSFISEILKDDDSKMLLASLINLLVNIGKTVIAEGIEEEKQLLWLKEQGCQVGQGYFYSKPVPLADALNLVSKNNIKD